MTTIPNCKYKFYLFNIDKVRYKTQAVSMAAFTYIALLLKTINVLYLHIPLSKKGVPCLKCTILSL